MTVKYALPDPGIKEAAMSDAIRFIEEEAGRVLPEVVEIRRDFHSHPELSFQELRTSERVASILERLGLEVRRGVATTGVVGLLRGRSDGPTIARHGRPPHKRKDRPVVRVKESRRHARLQP